MTDSLTTRQPPIVLFRARLTQRQSEIEAALEGTGVSFQQVRRASVTAAQQSPELLERVSFDSFWLALMKACRDGLLPDGVNGAIVPFKGTATWIPMYRGLVSRFQRSGHFKWIGADFHRKDDKSWRMWTDEMGPHFLHDKGPGTGVIVETYAAATTKDGGFFVTTVSPEDMQRIRNESRASREDSPWAKWPEQMMLKTAIRRLTKLLPVPDSVIMEEADGAPEAEQEEPETPKPRTRRSTRQIQDNFAGATALGIETGLGTSPPQEEPTLTEEMQTEESTLRSPQDYFDYAAGMITATDTTKATTWFNGEEQRSLRRKIGIPVADVSEFKNKFLPHA
jgi:recombination protein RecT